MKKQEKKCEFCKATFIDDTEYNKTACDQPECRVRYCESVHGDHDNPELCLSCGREYPPEPIFDKGFCGFAECQQQQEEVMHAQSMLHFTECKAEAYENFKASPLAKLPNEFGHENVDIAWHRYLTAGIKHHNKTREREDDQIDELILWQSEQYLSTLKSDRVHSIASHFLYFGRVADEPGVPWVKPLYAELEKGVPVAVVAPEPVQLQLF